VRTNLEKLKGELEQELGNILQYWMDHSIDEQEGGFYGRVDNENCVDKDASKGLVLNARILWTFSAACRHTQDNRYLVIAERAFNFLVDHFRDEEHGGFYWAVDKHGNVLETKKQVYGIAFCIYGLSEYYRAAGDERALQLAKDSYRLLEQYSFDSEGGGYFEAFTKDWRPVADLRLSAKDANEKKTMNTHLHVLEAYTNLYRCWPDESVKCSIRILLQNFMDHIVNRENGHLRLFFGEDWKVKDRMISYGHDIEAAWLLPEAAAIIGDKVMLEKIKQVSLEMAEAAGRGLDDDGGLWYESENGQLVKQKHSWPQAEAMIGFFTAWQLSGDERYLEKVMKTWAFIQQYIIDKKNGEWFWGINEDHSVMKDQDKIGFWKCPYHNSRACMEIIKRIQFRQNNKPA
jgi:mannobiose 2-epimerase